MGNCSNHIGIVLLSGIDILESGRWKEAEELFVQAMEISKTVLGAEHLDTLTRFQLRKSQLGLDHPDAQSALDSFHEWKPLIQK